MTTTLQQARSAGAQRAGWRGVMRSPMSAVGVIWLSAAAMSVFSPDMVTGSEQEHLPIAVLTVWLWAAVSTAYILMGTRTSEVSTASLVMSVSVIWIAVAIASIAAPMMVTGTDPTQIPIAVLVAPVVGATTTGLVVLHQAVSSEL